MASVANKLVFFTTLACAQNQIGIGLYTPPTPTEAMEDLMVLMESMAGTVSNLKNERDNLLTSISTLETKVSLAENKQPLADYFWMNDTQWSVWGNELAVKSFSVPAGQTLSFQMNVSTHQAGKNDALWIYLYKDGQKIASSVDDGDKKDDNSSLGMIYKEKTDPNQSWDSWYQVRLQGGPTERKIPATQMSMSYQFYGEDYPLTVL